jgi:hypothetical protein
MIIKTFNTRDTLNSKIQILLLWRHVSVQGTILRPSLFVMPITTETKIKIITFVRSKVKVTILNTVKSNNLKSVEWDYWYKGQYTKHTGYTEENYNSRFHTPAHLNFYFNTTILTTSSLRFDGLHYIESIM